MAARAAPGTISGQNVRKGIVMRPPKLKRSMGLWMATALVVGKRSLVFEQAADRLATEQAVLLALTTGEWE